ncbi:MAG: flagellin [Pirellulales bacterium]
MLGRIGATISGVELRLLNQLHEANNAAALNALRLATGKKINSPADNPTAFINLSELETERSAVTSALANVTDATSIVSQVQLTLDEIRTQLDTIRAKAVEDENQGLSASQRAANQTAIDEAIDQITELVNTTINGRRLLDGSAHFEVSGVNAAQIAEVQVISLGPNTSKTISGTVTTAAQQAQYAHDDPDNDVQLDDAVWFNVTGLRGTVTITGVNNETYASLASKINLESHLTGVTASVSGDDLIFTSVEYGSDETVAVTVNSGTFTAGSDSGVDAVATIDGRTYTGDGNRFDVVDNGFHAKIRFQGGFSGAFTSFTISGDALSFALTTDPANRSVLSLPGLQPVLLGGLSGNVDQLKTGGSLAGLNTNAPQAIRVIDEALAKLTEIEGLVDGFADAAISSSSALLDAIGDNLDDAIDDVNLVDDDEEELLQSKNEGLADNALTGLFVLDQQRSSILALIQQIAGLI